MLYFKKILLATCVAGFGFGGQLFAGEPVQSTQVVTVSTAVVAVPCHSQAEKLDDLLGRLEALVVPVHQKVLVCNEELEQAQANVETIRTQLVGFVAQRDKAVKGLKVLKAAFEQPGCTVEIGSCCYSRETVGAAVEVKLAEHTAVSLAIKTKSGELVAAQKVLEDTSAKVARWIAKEKELLTQIDNADVEGAVQASELSSILEKGDQLRLAISEMLKPAGKSVAPAAPAAEKSQLVVEIDEALSSK